MVGHDFHRAASNLRSKIVESARVKGLSKIGFLASIVANVHKKSRAKRKRTRESYNFDHRSQNLRKKFESIVRSKNITIILFSTRLINLFSLGTVSSCVWSSIRLPTISSQTPHFPGNCNGGTNYSLTCSDVTSHVPNRAPTTETSPRDDRSNRELAILLRYIKARDLVSRESLPHRYRRPSN